MTILYFGWNWFEIKNPWKLNNLLGKKVKDYAPLKYHQTKYGKSVEINQERLKDCRAKMLTDLQNGEEYTSIFINNPIIEADKKVSKNHDLMNGTNPL